MPLCCTEFARTKGLLSSLDPHQLVLGRFWVTKVYWWSGQGYSPKAKKWSDLVQRTWIPSIKLHPRKCSKLTRLPQVVWIGVFQYCFVRVLFTIVSVVTEALGRYCEESLNPAFAHIWVMVIEGAAVSIAMFFLVQFYLQLKTDLAEHKPFLKVLCIKLVIFFSFWQSVS